MGDDELLARIDERTAADHDRIVEIHSVLLGTNGQGGLIRKFAEHEKNDINFKKDYFKFKQRMIIILAFAAGSGALGISIVKVLGI